MALIKAVSKKVNPGFLDAKQFLSKTSIKEEMDDLPESVKNQLTIENKTQNKMNNFIIDILKSNGGFASKNQITIFLYKRYHVEISQASLYGRLTDLVKNNLIFRVEGVKSCYSLTPLTVEYEE